MNPWRVPMPKGWRYPWRMVAIALTVHFTFAAVLIVGCYHIMEGK